MGTCHYAPDGWCDDPKCVEGCKKQRSAASPVPSKIETPCDRLWEIYKIATQSRVLPEDVDRIAELSEGFMPIPPCSRCGEGHAEPEQDCPKFAVEQEFHNVDDVAEIRRLRAALKDLSDCCGHDDDKALLAALQNAAKLLSGDPSQVETSVTQPSLAQAAIERTLRRHEKFHLTAISLLLEAEKVFDKIAEQNGGEPQFRIHQQISDWLSEVGTRVTRSDKSSVETTARQHTDSEGDWTAAEACPPEKASDGLCNTSNDGFRCTLDHGHEGQHEAWGIDRCWRKWPSENGKGD